MTADSIDMLSDKIDGVKEDLLRDVAGINKKLDDIQRWMLERPMPCPKPGLCVVLERRADDQHEQILQLQLAVAKIQKWRYTVAGGFGLLMIGLTIFGPSIRFLLKLP